MRIFYNSAKTPVIREIEEARPGAWLHMEEPSQEELQKLAKEYSLDLDLLHDGIDVNELPRIEREETTTYIFTRYCLPETEKLTTSPLLIIYSEEMIITVCPRPFPGVERLLAKNIFTSKRAQLVLAILNEINTGYKQRINQVSRRILQIRNQLNKLQIENKDFISFIDIEEDLNDFLLVLEPMDGVLNTLLGGRFLRLYEDDRDLIEDLSLGAAELTQLAQSRLTTIRNIREAYSTITANNLNRLFRLLTALTVLLSSFTLITSFYGMNVPLPFAHQGNTFWVILAFTTLTVVTVLYLLRRKRWL